MSGLPGDAQERLAKLLVELWEEDAGEPVDGLPGVSEAIDAYLARFLPVVERLAAEHAAEELRAAADDPAICFIAASPSFGLPVRVVNVAHLYARAAALTTERTTP